MEVGEKEKKKRHGLDRKSDKDLLANLGSRDRSRFTLYSCCLVASIHSFSFGEREGRGSNNNPPL